MALKILIIGAGVAGPALVVLLQRSSAANPNLQYDITVLERSPTLRRDGLQLDIRAQGIPIIRKLGLEEKIRERCAKETELVVVDASGKERASFGQNRSGQGQQALVSEFEIMRKEIVDVFVEESERGSGVKYEFGKSVAEFHDTSESEGGIGGGVDVTFSDGSKGRYDIVIGADGQSSRTRRMLLGQEKSDASWKSLNLYCAYYTRLIPASDSREAPETHSKAYVAPNRRVIFTRPGGQVYLATMSANDVPQIKSSLSESKEQQMRAWADAFADEKGWIVPDLVQGLRESEDFYAQEIAQIKLPTESDGGSDIAKGRVALLGDAGYTPSPITGMGTTLALTGAYILAGEIARHVTNKGEDDVQAALESYKRVVRPFIDEAQKLPPGAPDILYLQSNWAVAVANTLLGVVSALGLYDLVNRILPENKGGLRLPEYPELNLHRSE